MGETRENLLAWDQPVDRGSLDTAWVCPTAGIEAIEEMLRSGQEITDETLIASAGGRWRHLKWFTFGATDIGGSSS